MARSSEVSHPTAEHQRLADHRARAANWRQWGPYLAERAWGSVREDYGRTNSPWQSFPHDHARSRAYRWNEDGLAGISDRRQYLCFAVALWNGNDPILKERLFGLTGLEGNHGEDVKECYFYLDATPTASYLKMLYKYPQRAFPYAELVKENGRRGADAFEYELLDTGAFAGDRYFDVVVEYAKAAPDDIWCRIAVTNRGGESARCDVLPTLWFRNTWSWGYPNGPLADVAGRPAIAATGDAAVCARHAVLGEYGCAFAAASGVAPELLFTENETDRQRIYGESNSGPDAVAFVKDGLHKRVVQGEIGAVNPDRTGTKCAAWFQLQVAAGGTETVYVQLARSALPDPQLPRTAVDRVAGSGAAGGAAGGAAPTGAMAGAGDSAPAGAAAPAGGPVPAAAHLTAGRTAQGAPTSITPYDGDAVVAARRSEADQFYAHVQTPTLDAEERAVQRQALAGLLWSKQLYYFDVEQWLRGDPGGPPVAAARRTRGNEDWAHLNNFDVIAMPDKWEYPWYATWDLAFHCVAMVQVDPNFAKRQLQLFVREWFMHPNGQLPAYEWAFGDVNPPVHAWAAWRVYQLDAVQTGKRDRYFLREVFHKLLLNFNWWVNRKDADGHNIFQGGFLGLDNISLFDRSKELPTGGHIDQSDGTGWMGFFCSTMMRIALELAVEDSVYEDLATKFFEHFLAIARAMTDGAGGHSLWDERDGFYYDSLHLPDGTMQPLRVRSLVGLMPLLAVEILDASLLVHTPVFERRMHWFLEHRPHLSGNIASVDTPGIGKRRLAAILTRDRLIRVLHYLLDEAEFLSPYGIRSLSRVHKDQPFSLRVNGTTYGIDYQPAESTTAMFGGNSNWRGPVWFPINFLLIEALQKFHLYYGGRLKVPFPAGSNTRLSLRDIATRLSRRLIDIFLREADGSRPADGGTARFRDDPHWRDLLLFHEYFHGDNGAGLGASHQTGWTALVATLLQRSGGRATARGQAR